MQLSYIQEDSCTQIFMDKMKQNTPLCRRLSILVPLRIRHQDHPCLFFFYLFSLFFELCVFWNEWMGNQKNWDLIFMRDSKLNQEAETYCVQYVHIFLRRKRFTLRIHTPCLSTEFLFQQRYLFGNDILFKNLFWPDWEKSLLLDW